MNKSCPKLELFMIDWSDFFLRQYQEHKNICFYTMNKCRNIMSSVEFNFDGSSRQGKFSLGPFLCQVFFSSPNKRQFFPFPNSQCQAQVASKGTCSFAELYHYYHVENHILKFGINRLEKRILNLRHTAGTIPFSESGPSRS